MSCKKIAIGSDHAGFRLKEALVEHLRECEYEVIDCGTNSDESCDYPVYAKKVCDAVLSGADFGVLVCGTGIGMSMCANKVKGIRAACLSDTFSARMTRMHNDANIVCVGERVVGFGLAADIVDLFINTEFEGGKHKRRIDMFE